MTTSLEAMQDTGNYGEGSFASWLPQELTRSLINQESLFLLQGNYSGGPTSTFNGWLATSGTLTRSVGTDTPLDALSKAYVDLRVGPAFAEPDLVVMHPSTIGGLRREKDANGRYIMDLLAGPLALTADGSQVNRPAGEFNSFSIIKQGTGQSHGNLWGAPIVGTTQCPAGTAIVASIRAGGGLFWTRLGLRIEFSMWGDSLFPDNLYQYRAEERIALSVNRPSALNIVTGLPQS